MSHGAQDWAIELKGGRGDKVSGLTAFRQRYPKASVWLVGPTGIKFDEFFARPASASLVARRGGWQYSHTMTAITEQLEATLKRLDDRAAASLVRLVRDALELASVQRAARPCDRPPADFFTRIAGEFGPEPFERPPQGTLEKRGAW